MPVLPEIYIYMRERERERERERIIAKKLKKNRKDWHYNVYVKQEKSQAFNWPPLSKAAITKHYAVWFKTAIKI